MAVPPVYGYGTVARVEQDLDDLEHVQPGRQSERGRALQVGLRRVQSKHRRVWVRNKQFDDLQALGGKE